ncbi:7951_t:CDS:1, partial [Entrophospora sp. SA101]
MENDNKQKKELLKQFRYPCAQNMAKALEFISSKIPLELIILMELTNLD